jgi:S-formylglutathione hydrolase FrmB
VNRLRSLPAPLAAALLSLLAIAALATGCGKKDGRDNVSSLTVIEERELEPRLREYTFATPSLHEEAKVRVLLPPGYEESGKRYPVLYLLHGADADSGFWTVAGVEELIGDRELIVVMPDGDTSFYSDWFNGGKGGPPRWETFHVGELIPWVDNELRTVATKDGRAIAGNSMGGLGALLYAAHNPGTFRLAASFSGTVVAEPAPMAQVLASTGRDPSYLLAVWGPYPEEAAVWDRHNPVAIAAELEGTELVLVAGNGRIAGDPAVNEVEALIGQMNATLHRRLDQLGIEHAYQPGPGVHDVPYWQRALRKTLPRIESALAP